MGTKNGGLIGLLTSRGGMTVLAAANLVCAFDALPRVDAIAWFNCALACVYFALKAEQ